ncbi:MAG: elongation factor 1-beta [Candidatus Aenigmarchaeota archaeon]|nr:elongation factor 1-beta [Candidatus Aenigmarchaeota archaeon]
MGQVALTLKVMPESPDIDVNKIVNEIKELETDVVKVSDISIEDVAFGLKAIKVLFVMPDKTVSPSEIEEKIKKIEGVGEVETESVTLV